MSFFCSGSTDKWNSDKQYTVYMMQSVTCINTADEFSLSPPCNIDLHSNSTGYSLFTFVFSPLTHNECTCTFTGQMANSL